MAKRPALFLTALIALIVVLGIDRLSAIWVAEDAAELDPEIERASNVVVLPKVPENLPKPRPGPSVLLIGNSHTYALPSLEPGHPLQPDPGVTLIDTLASHVGAEHATFYRLAYPNFLPLEMLTRVAQLYHSGYRPTVVVIGLTWRNLARDSNLREQIRRAFRDPSLAPALESMLTDLDLRQRIQVEALSVARDVEQERTRSAADRIDEAIGRWLGTHVALLGKSNALRARIYLWLNVAITERFVGRQQEFAYDVIPTDLELNRRAFDALLELLHRRGARVVIYQAPERNDLPPMMDPEKQEEIMSSIRARSTELGFTMLDARRVIPNELWGWAYDAPDRSHFTQPGHDLLGRFLADHAPEIRSALEAP